MNDGTGRVPRLVVGISRSRASWWALAWAVGEARRRGARLLLVNVFRPPVAPVLADYDHGGFGVARDPYAGRAAYGNALIRTAIAQAVGQMPGDVAVEQQVVSGRPAAELASLAWGGDLLVLGSRRRGWLRRSGSGGTFVAASPVRPAGPVEREAEAGRRGPGDRPARQAGPRTALIKCLRGRTGERAVPQASHLLARVLELHLRGPAGWRPASRAG